MKPPADGWDDDERALVALIDRDLASVQERHPGTPPLDLLRASVLDALPDDVGSTVRQAAQKPWNAALLSGLNSPPIDLSLERESERRVFERVRAAIREEASHEDASHEKAPAWSWQPMLAMAAAVVLVVATLAFYPTRVAAPDATSVGVAPPAAPQPQAKPEAVTAYLLPLQKPDVTISAASLTWRSDAGESGLLADLKAPLDAFRRDDYSAAAEGFAPLMTRYPSAVEPAYYLGLSKLLGGDAEGATDPLARAESLATDSMAGDAAWFRAVAFERIGRLQDARAALARVCASGGSRSSAACAAVPRFEH